MLGRFRIEYCRRVFWLLVSCAATSSCGGGQPSSVAAVAPPAAARASLSAEELLGAVTLGRGPLPNRYLAPLGELLPARAELAGQLRVGETPMRSSSAASSSELVFPAFETELYTHRGYLVPTERGIIGSDGPASRWRIILSPGRVWAEGADDGWSRAALPFVLVTDQSNEAHNGIATFLFDGQRLSDIYFQVVQESASWARHDYWGRLEPAFAPGEPTGLSRLRSEFDAELASLPRTAPWSELPAQDPAGLGALLHRGLAPEDVSATGLLVDGTLYMPDCATRYGPFPYCEFMRHGAYSVTKSTGALLAFLRLAQKYGDAIARLRIADYVSIEAEHDGWSDVTFADALNMATGVGGGNSDRGAVDPFADETPSRFHAWADAPSAADKLRVVFAAPDYPWGPGEVFRYNTGQTFLLGVAMDRFLKRQEGPQADLWDMVSSEVLAPLGIHASPMMRTLEAQGRGVPLWGIGMYPSAADVARIATLLQNGGAHRGEQLLHAELLAEALLASGAGLPTGETSAAGAAVYHLSFWSLPFQSRAGCIRQLPYMNGYGGNFVMLLPNGIVAFRFADADFYDVEPLALVADEIAPVCP